MDCHALRARNDDAIVIARSVATKQSTTFTGECLMRKLKNILITGGAGFIGSNFIHYLFGLSSAQGNLFGDANFDGTVVNVDCLT